ncbi:serine/threonine protein kinase [Streptomyces scopuliridis]|uniref:Serine/threonine protein kinase n=1 Tax=Streptomyces scopuliridis TaxID=452529 RepID=A0ACD4ZRF8_9ACTN|nr:serine/threonine-protein kinase [Streptomyces scopuliridis]WSC00989.1 serine/threonine protein kinase [Streptomyces scopuliridis]WSC05401.1 serine/threonine protein kinase [Streptomyces scopuliridis]
MSRPTDNLALVQPGQDITGAKVLQPLRAGDPTTVGNFRLVGRLGQGAMGVVYLGYRSTRPVAVKVVRPQLAEDEYFRKRFALELEAIRRVGGFHTAALVDADSQAATPWIATQYINAPSLLELLEQHGPVSELGAWWLAAGLADALMHVHSVRLLHRDLKPGNVLVAADGVRVIDFGISHVSGGTGLTTASAALGTLSYMAPEQAADSRRASEAADVYSLGATLVHAATGHVPFYAQIPAQRTLDTQPDLSGLPPALLDLVTHTLAFDAEDRPTAQSVLEEAMGRLLDFGVPTEAQAYPPLPEAFLAEVLERQATPVEAPDPVSDPDAVVDAEPDDGPNMAPEPVPEAAPFPRPAAPLDPGPRPGVTPDRWAARWRSRIEDRRSDYGG